MLHLDCRMPIPLLVRRGCLPELGMEGHKHNPLHIDDTLRQQISFLFGLVLSQSFLVFSLRLVLM